MSQPFSPMLFACGSNDKFARQVASHIDVNLEETIYQEFSDGDMFRYQKNTVRDRNLFVICQPRNGYIKYKDLFECFTLVSSLRQGSPKSWITAVIPYLPYSRQDKSKDRKPILSPLIPNLLKASGANHIVVTRLHNAATNTKALYMPMEDINVDDEVVKAIRLHCKDIISRGKFKIGSPDVGGSGYATVIASIFNVEVVMAHKNRNQDNGDTKIFNIIGDVDDYDLILVDDIGDTGGTISKAKKAFVEKGAKKVACIMVHPVLSGPNGKAIVTLNSGDFDVVMFTNSRYLSRKEKNSIHNYKEIDISQLTANVIANLNNSESLQMLWSREE